MTRVLADPHNLNVKIAPKIVGLYAIMYGIRFTELLEVLCY